MKKLVLCVLAAAVCLCAADFWTSKPYNEWNQKELQKIMTDSPWAHRVDIELSVRAAGADAQPGGGRGRGGGSRDILNADGTAPLSAGRDSSAGAGGDAGGGGGRGGAATAGQNEGPMIQTTPVMIVWQTALPVRQALAKAKYGSEVATSPEAKTFLEREEQYYVIGLSGLPGFIARGAGEGEKKQALLQLTALNVKGKDALHAVEVQFTPRQALADAVFFFPRSTAFSADDKEIEFATKFDRTSVKYRFKLKDMTYHGKLEM